MTDKADLINLEILRMAKELVTNEYIDRRAQLHNTWLKESEEVLNSKGINLPYPDIPDYPTEETIVKRAQILLDFLITNSEKTKQAEAEQQPVESTVESPKKEIIEPQVTPVTLADVKIPELNTCTGPTGAVTETCTGPTGVAQSGSKSKTRIPLPPDEKPKTADINVADKILKSNLPVAQDVLPYARLRVDLREEQDQSSMSNMIPGLLNALKQNNFK